MTDPRPAVHRTLVVVDVEGFGDPRRTSRNQVAVRDGLWRAVKRAFRQAGIRWAGCHREDRGDGVLILAPAHVPKGRFVDALPRAFVTALEEHNRGCSAEERMRLRMAVHAGEVIYDRHGVAGASVNLVFRLVEAEPLKAALASSPGMLAVIASRWFFEEVIRHLPSSGPASYRPVRVLVKETSTTAWICLPDNPYPADADAALPPPPLAMAPRQLPAMVAGFVGRAAELTALDSLLEESADAGTMMISVVGGTAGVGKTSLAVHWARTVAAQFPDGQLYVDLRGFDPSGSPMTSAEAVRGFLDAFEVPPERVPVSLDAQAALYRTLLAGRRVLVVADNARDAEQVRPLLPGSVGCVVVVTSRNRLTSLISAEGARPLTLDLLTCEEAGQLLSRRIGVSRVAAEPQAAEKIIALCTRLPLALSIVAARAAAHPGFSLETLAAELCHAPCAPLGALDGGDRVTDMRAVFHWSYRQLSASAARLFRLLGLHGGPDVTAPAAASLAGLPQQAVWPLLTELTLAHMVTEHVAGRFALHDLLRAYAAEHANIRNVDDERQAAVRRMLDHYLHSAYNAAIWLHPRASPITLAPPVPGVVPQQLADDTAALAWFEAEYPVLLRTIKLSADTGQTVHAWQLPWTLTEFFARRGHWHDWAASQDTALVAAQHGADRHGQAHSHRGLGQAWYRLGRYDQAHKHFQQAIRLFQELSDQAGQADTHLALGWMLGYQGRPEEALRRAQQALSLTRATGSRHGQARALLSVGWDHALLGEYEQAISCCQQALALFRQFGDRRSESRTLDGLGYAHYHLGCHQQAIAYFRQALVLYRELGDRHGQAVTLNHLGDAHHATADLDAADEAWQQAIGILEQLGAVVTETSTHAPLHPA